MSRKLTERNGDHNTEQNWVSRKLSLCCILICWFMQKYTYIYWIHTDPMITDTVINDAGRTSLTIFLPLTLLQGFERAVQRLHVRGCWRPNINFIFWPHCYDRHVVSFLFSWCWGQLHRRFPRALSVGCGLPYHLSSLTPWESAGNCFGTPNSTELNNNSTPTRSPTGSLKSNV